MKCSKFFTVCLSLLVMSSAHAIQEATEAQMDAELQEVQVREPTTDQVNDALSRTGALNRDQSIGSIGKVGGVQMKAIKLGKCSTAGSYQTSGCVSTNPTAAVVPREKEVLDDSDTRAYALEQTTVRIREQPVDAAQ